MIEEDGCLQLPYLGGVVRIGRSEQGRSCIGIEVGGKHVIITPGEAMTLSGYIAGLAQALFEEGYP